jgi:hypothetical protein
MLRRCLLGLKSFSFRPVVVRLLGATRNFQRYHYLIALHGRRLRDHITSGALFLALLFLRRIWALVLRRLRGRFRRAIQEGRSSNGSFA